MNDGDANSLSHIEKDGHSSSPDDRISAMNNDTHSPKVLSTIDLSRSFQQIPANEKITLDLNFGEIHALIGPNGAGKSTFIKQIAGSLKPDSGKVLFCGKDITALDTAARARLGLARTFQVSALAMENTVLENALLGSVGCRGRALSMFAPVLRDVSVRQIAESALDRVGLSDRMTLRAAELSHGERRQLEIAVALTLKPKAFVMDEPMAGMGTQGSGKLTRLLKQLKKEAPILLVEHDMDAVFALADRISVLVYGKIIATGSVDQIRSNDDVRRAYLGDFA